MGCTLPISQISLGATLPAIFLALVCAGALVALGDLSQATWQAMAVLLVWGVAMVGLPMPRWERPAAVLGAAVLVRGVLLASPASLSDDLYRYLWEGRVVGMGGNPYLTPPADPAWASLGPDPILALVNHPEVSSVYPPLAMWIFAGVAAVAYSPLGIKVLMGIADALVAGCLAQVLRGRGLPMGAAWLYALHPLGAVESAGSGHLEALALLPMVLAIRAWDRGGPGIGWAGLGALIKLAPGVLLPTLWRRSPWLLLPLGALALVASWPFLDAGPALLAGMHTYAELWAFNAGGYAVLEALLGASARPVAQGLGLVVVLLCWWRLRDPARVALWVGGAFLLLSPVVHPWYIVWAWVPALICGVRGWTVLATLVPLSYAALATYDPATSTWVEPWWPVWIEYPPLVALLLWDAFRHQLRPGPWAPRAVEAA